MKTLIKRLILFLLLPVCVLYVVENFLPPTLFTFRCWEALAPYKGKYFVGNFYPNKSCSMTERGDLGHHTPYAIQKQVTWKTDKLGFRNDIFIEEPDILIIGDSNIVGSGLDQPDTLSNQLAQLTGLKVYSIASCDINDYIELFNAGIIRRPKVLICSSIERYLPRLSLCDPRRRLRHSFIKQNPIIQSLAQRIDKLIRANSLEYLRASYLRATSASSYPPRKGDIILFQGKSAVLRENEENIQLLVRILWDYQAYARATQSRFIFVPIPNKETIYWDLLNLPKQPGFLTRLIPQLQQAGIATVDTLSLFNQLKEKNIMPYHKDDTHWNKNGVAVTAKQLAQMLNSFSMEKEQDQTHHVTETPNVQVDNHNR